MFKVYQYDCPYCGGPINDESDHKHRYEIPCPWCGKKIVFDRDGGGYFTLWYATWDCLDCRNRRIEINDGLIRWHCLKHGCEVVNY